MQQSEVLVKLSAGALLPCLQNLLIEMTTRAYKCAGEVDKENEEANPHKPYVAQMASRERSPFLVRIYWQ